MAQVGRISGPLLEANLIRNGVDLAFRNDLDTTQLLYLNVNDGKISVNYESQPSYEIQIVGTTKTTDLIADYANISNFTINNSTISAVVGDINLDAAEAIVIPALDNGTLFIDGNFISSSSSNANIDLMPHGTGVTEIYDNLHVLENASVTGNVTLNGSINLGDADTDNITFSAEITSDIIPDQSGVFDLGSATRRWQNLYTNLLNGQAISTGSISVGLIDYTLPMGNIFYVDPNGTDSNKGDHMLAPVASIRRALELADASVSGPVVIYINSGDYEEETPLVVPSNVSIIGADIRNVKIFPTSYTLSEDVFHLNGETTISNLTIKNFYYNDNKGYAFRFAPNAVITSRSPYIQDVTVITQGSNTTPEDPRGFDSADAGRGAYIDGAELNSSSVDASMLFHSCTFITPNADTIVMTNGVRVEWLNSFTYFANRGLYAFNNSTGRVSNDGSTVNYGAEIRSIGSANVYGNYGAVADGSDTLMYLIQHNFAYVGSGKDSTNDNGLSIQANEVVEENGGQIHYVTTDHTGAFRIGDNFFIDFETGSTSVDLSSLTADSLNGLVITTGADTTFITGEKIETGNIKISENTIETLAGDLNLDTATGEIDLNDNTNVSGNLDITGNLTFGGNLSLLGNQTTDTIKFNVDLDQDLNPNTDSTFTLGSVSKQWINAWLSRLESGNVSIFDNVITTDVSNASLELRAAGSGEVIFNETTTISNDLTVSGQLTSDAGITINGNLLQDGGTVQDGSFTLVGNLQVDADVEFNSSVELEEILINDNVITTTTSNADLELRANGTGKVLLPNNNVRIQNNLSAGDTDTSSNVNVNLQTEFNIADVSTVRITQNYITTNESNADLELRATGSTTAPGDLDFRYVEDEFYFFIEARSQGNATDYYVGYNFGTTEYKRPSAIGFSTSGPVTWFVESTWTYFDHNGNRYYRGDLVTQVVHDVGPPLLYRRYYFINRNNERLPDVVVPAGDISVLSNNVELSQDLIVSGLTTLQETSITGNLTHLGNRTQTGNYAQTGDAYITGDLLTDRRVQFEDIEIDGNVITTTLSNSDLELRASGTGEVVLDNDVRVSNNLFAASITAGNINIDQDLVLDEIEIPPSIIRINDNYITTKISNADLDLRANGNGVVIIPSNNVVLEQNLTVNRNTDIDDLTINGTLTQTGNTAKTGNISLTGNVTFSSLILDRALDFDDIRIAGNVLETTLSNSSLELKANGSGQVIFNDNLVIDQNLDTGTLNVSSISIDDSISFEEIELSTDIQFFDNVITTTNSNSNLELGANGTGSIYLQNLEFTGNTVKTSASNIIIDASDNLILNSTGAIQLPKGTTSQRKNTLGDIRFNTTNNVFEATGSGVVTFGGVYSSDRRTSVLAHPTNNTINFTVNNVAVGSIAAAGITLHGLSVDDISINSNTIQTTVSNSDLELRTDGTGELVIDDISFVDNEIKNGGNNLIFYSTDFGHYKIGGTYGTVVPSGNNNTDRPVSPPLGDTRWNTTDEILETWDGSQYISAAGTSTAISEEDFNNLLFEYTLIFG